MKKNILIIGLLLGFALMGWHQLSAQIVIGNGSADQVKAADEKHTLLELRNDTSNGALSKAGKGFLMPRMDSTKKRKMGEYKSKAGVDIPYGTLVYDTSNHMIFVWTKLGNDSLWRPLAFVAGKERVQAEFLDIDSSNLDNNPFKNNTGGNGAGSNNGTQELTVKTPDGYLTYLQLKKDNSSSQNTTTAIPVVDLAYNGLTLIPGRDYTATFENGSSSSGNTQQQSSATSKVKIKFLTIDPEDWNGFSRFGIQYIPLEK